MKHVLRPLLLAVTLFVVAAFAPSAGANTVVPHTDCGCVTPKLAKWFGVNGVDTTDGHHALRGMANNSSTPAQANGMLDSMLPTIHLQVRKTLDKFKTWWNDVCPADAWWCKAAKRCLFYGTAAFVTAEINGASEAKAIAAGLAACFTAALAGFLNVTPPHDQPQWQPVVARL